MAPGREIITVYTIQRVAYEVHVCTIHVEKSNNSQETAWKRSVMSPSSRCFVVAVLVGHVYCDVQVMPYHKRWKPAEKKSDTPSHKIFARWDPNVNIKSNIMFPPLPKKHFHCCFLRNRLTALPVHFLRVDRGHPWGISPSVCTVQFAFPECILRDRTPTPPTTPSDNPLDNTLRKWFMELRKVPEGIVLVRAEANVRESYHARKFIRTSVLL